MSRRQPTTERTRPRSPPVADARRPETRGARAPARRHRRQRQRPTVRCAQETRPVQGTPQTRCLPPPHRRPPPTDRALNAHLPCVSSEHREPRLAAVASQSSLCANACVEVGRSIRSPLPRDKQPCGPKGERAAIWTNSTSADGPAVDRGGFGTNVPLLDEFGSMRSPCRRATRSTLGTATWALGRDATYFRLAQCARGTPAAAARR